MNEGRPEAPQGLRVRARAISGLGALESLGVRAAVQAVLLGPERFDALRRIDYVEPLLLRRSIETEEVPALERVFARCSDIYAHLPTLYRLTVDGKRKRTLELGTRDGDSTIALLLAAREIGGTLTSVDLEPCPIATARVDGAGLRDLWTFVQQDDLGLDWDRPIDHLFVDTSHRYSHTIDELRKYEPFVVSGGVISLHDTTTFPAVWHAIEEYFRGRRDVRIFRYFHNNGLTLVEKGVCARA